MFNPRTPCRSATDMENEVIKRVTISIHAPRVGVRHRRWREQDPKIIDFNPRTPCRSATEARMSTHARAFISIHATRVGVRLSEGSPIIAGTFISIHATRVGVRRALAKRRLCAYGRFQSTQPV